MSTQTWKPRRINAIPPVKEKRMAGYNWDLSVIAFKDPFEVKTRNQKDRETQRER